MHVYCLFCQTQRCKLIATVLQKHGAGRVLSPQILQRERKQGRNVEVMRSLLPGYIFIYAEEPLTEEQFHPGIYGIIRRLGTAETGFELSGADCDFAMRLYEKDGTVNAVQVFKEGDEIVLTDPLFQSCKGRITKVDNRKQRARIDFTFENNPCHTWVAFEVIEKQGQPDSDQKEL